MSDIAFAQIPQNLRVPLFYAELNNSQANTAQSAQPTLLIGQMLTTGSATPNEPVQCAGPANAIALCGAGSILAQMAATYLKIDPAADLWLLPLSDPSGGAAATGAIAFAGSPTANGTISLYIADQLISIPVTTSESATSIAAAAVAAITAAYGCPLSAVVDGVTVTKVDVTALNKGTLGNGIGLALNLGGNGSGQATPAGLTVTITAMSGGTGVPVLATALANLTSHPADFIGHQFVDTTSIAAITAFLADIGGRWAYNAQIYGHAYGSIAATFSAAGTFGSELNDQHQTFLPVNGSATMNWNWAAWMTALVAQSIRADPALPLQFIGAAGVMAPPIADRFDAVVGETNTLLYEGMSVFDVLQGGICQLLAVITTYQLNAENQPDNSYLYVTTLYTLMAFIRGMKNLVLSKYSRIKLVTDGSRPTPGSGVVTPATIEADLNVWYQSQIPQLVQNAAYFAANLIVEQNAQNPNRVDVFAEPILTGGISIFAVLNEFLLATPASATTTAAAA
jgi:phage tail sheath gpL-like